MKQADKLSIRLTPSVDRNGKQFFIGKIKAPATIDLKDGAVFLVFVSELGNEEIQIATDDKTKDKKHENKYEPKEILRKSPSHFEEDEE